MFILTVLEDEVALHPSQFGPNQHIPRIKSMIEAKYVDRVVPDVGLVMALYDIVKVRDAYIFPGDLKDSQGEAACTVVFRVVVFRPKLNELLIGRVHSSTPMGLQVSIGFFQDVTIPVNQLRAPGVYDERLRTWVWQYRDDNDKAINYPYQADELICLRVKSVQFTDSLDSSLSAARRAQALSASNKAVKIPTGQAVAGAVHLPQDQPPMLVVGSVEEDGLGLLSWWL